MAKWAIIWNQDSEGTVSKDGKSYIDIDVSWLPSNILAVQSSDGTTCEIEYGDRTTETVSHNESDISTSSLSWWSSATSAWQSAYNAEQAEVAEDPA